MGFVLARVYERVCYLTRAADRNTNVPLKHEKYALVSSSLNMVYSAFFLFLKGDVFPREGIDLLA